MMRFGQNHPNTRMTENVAREIRKRWKDYSMDQRKEIAQVSGFAYVTLKDIALGKSWRHLDEPVTYDPSKEAKRGKYERPDNKKIMFTITKRREWLGKGMGYSCAEWTVRGHEHIHVFNLKGKWTATDKRTAKILFQEWTRRELARKLEGMLT